MSILAVADCHIGDHAWCRGRVVAGISERAQEGLDALAQAVALAVDLRVDRLVVLGDLFDTARPTPVLVAAVQRILAGAPNPTVLVGNHDQESELAGHHACAPLYPVATVVDRVAVLPAGAFDIVLAAPVPSQPALDGTLQLLTDLPQATRPRVLGLHLGLADAGVPTHLREAHDAMLAGDAGGVVAKRCGASVVLAGNWHWPSSWVVPGGAVVGQCGTLCPHDFRDAGQAGWAVEVSDDGQVRWHEIPGPRFLRLPSMQALQEQYPDGLPPHVYVQVVAQPGEALPVFEPAVRVVQARALKPEDTAPDTPPTEDVLGLLVSTARSQVPDHLAETVEQAVTQLWRHT